MKCAHSMKMTPHRAFFIIKKNERGDQAVPMLPIRAQIDLKSKNDVYIMHTFDLTDIEVQIKIGYGNDQPSYEGQTGKKSIYS